MVPQTSILQAQQLKTLKAAFNKFDTDGSGTIDGQELKYVLKEVSVLLTN